MLSREDDRILGVFLHIARWAKALDVARPVRPALRQRDDVVDMVAATQRPWAVGAAMPLQLQDAPDIGDGVMAIGPSLYRATIIRKCARPLGIGLPPRLSVGGSLVGVPVAPDLMASHDRELVLPAIVGASVLRLVAGLRRMVFRPHLFAIALAPCLVLCLDLLAILFAPSLLMSLGAPWMRRSPCGGTDGIRRLVAIKARGYRLFSHCRNRSSIGGQRRRPVSSGAASRFLYHGG